jgi:hypothetical protein
MATTTPARPRNAIVFVNKVVELLSLRIGGIIVVLPLGVIRPPSLRRSTAEADVSRVSVGVTHASPESLERVLAVRKND